MALVPDFNYDNNQIDTERWETRQVIAVCYWDC